MLACWVHWNLKDFFMCSAGYCWILWRHFDFYNRNLNPSLRFNERTSSLHLPVIIGIENCITKGHSHKAQCHMTLPTYKGSSSRPSCYCQMNPVRLMVSCSHLIAICDLLLASLLTLLVGSQQWSSQRVIVHLQDIVMIVSCQVVIMWYGDTDGCNYEGPSWVHLV